MDRNEEQQRYIQARFELENLEYRKDEGFVLSDDEYEETVRRIPNLEERQEFENTYIPQSKYDEDKKHLTELMAEIDEKNADIISQKEKYMTSVEAHAHLERGKLKLIKKYCIDKSNFTVL